MLGGGSRYYGNRICPARCYAGLPTRFPFASFLLLSPLAAPINLFSGEHSFF
jgi:hypothetical protein